LEPKGPSTTIANINQRIPAGEYNLLNHIGKKYQNVPKLINHQVPGWRYILIHRGSKPNNTKGCLLAGHEWAPDAVGTFNNISKKWESDDRIEGINSFLNEVGHKNVRLKIVNIINNEKKRK